MSRVNTPTLTEAAKAELEARFRTDPNHTLRMRCQLILLKAEGRDSKQVAGIVKTAPAARLRDDGQQLGQPIQTGRFCWAAD